MKHKSLLTAFVVVALALMASGVYAHSLAVTAPGLSGTGFKLELQYLGADPSLAFVSDNTPDNETIYRAKVTLNLNGADTNSFRAGSGFFYFFQAFGDGYFAGVGGCAGAATARPAIRLGIQKAGTNYGIRAFTFDNQCNRRGTLPACLIGNTSADVDVQVQWQQRQGGATDNFSLQTFEGGVMTCDVSETVQNTAISITDSILLTLPDAASPVTVDTTIFVDEFESFRTLAP